MNIEHDEHDVALDKVLAAMRDAVPPEGLGGRITKRLQQHVTAPSAAPSRWRDVLANHSLTAEWWQGAITGAATILLVAATFLLAGHLQQRHRNRALTALDSTAERNAAMPVNSSPDSMRANSMSPERCAHPAMLQTATVVPPPTTDSLRKETRLESDAPSRPAPPLPLTAQERALVRLAQTSTPKQIAMINPAEYANLEAQSALKFEKIFAPPVPPPAMDGNTTTDPTLGSGVNSESDPKPDSSITPPAESGEKP